MMLVMSSTLGRLIRWRWIIVFGLVGVMLMLPNCCALDLYSARDASTSRFHEDLEITGDPSRADAALVLLEWATSLNLTGSLVHNINIRDRESVERCLQQLLTSGENLNHLNVRLNMSDTDVATFQFDNNENILSLHELSNQTRMFDELQAAEVTFREQKNFSGLKSVDLRGEDLRTKIHRNYETYSARYDRIINISREFGVPTSAFEQSLKDFAAIVAEIDAIQDVRSDVTSEMMRNNLAASAISFRILPDRGVYGDTLSMAGVTNVPSGTEVALFVDGLQVNGVVIDDSGRFVVPYRVEKIDALPHTAYASIASYISDVNTFTVEGRNTTISLTVRPVTENGIRKSIGTGRLLTEDGVPVRGARVSVNVDGRASGNYGMTGDDGEYTLTIERLLPGVHTLKARFHPGGFPLSGSESAPVTVEGPPQSDWIGALIYLLTIGGSALGGILYLRDRHPTVDPPSAGSMAEEPGDRVEPLQMTIEEAGMIADQITVTNEGQTVGHETIAQTYSRLVRELEAKNPDLRLRPQTPRHLAVLFADRPFGDQLGVLVGIHEKVRYAGHEPTGEELRQVREAFIDIVTEGREH